MKKFLSLVLALVMTMSLVTVSAGAKDFTDADSVNYVEAVEVMKAVDVIGGYPDGSFGPAKTLTRAEAAKIICNLILGPTEADALVATADPFKDVKATNWAAGYIAFCASEGIIVGVGDGNFNPQGTLTGYQFMKMLLCALGYDAAIEGYVGANWNINVAKRAIALGLDDDLDGAFVGTKAVTREEACLFALNMIQNEMVEYGRLGVATAKKTTDTFMKEYFKNLKQNTDKKNDAFGRPEVSNFTLKNANGKTEQIAYVAKKPVATYNVATAQCDICDDLDESKEAKMGTVWTNGRQGAGKTLVATNTKTKEGAQGQIVEIYDMDVTVTADNNEQQYYRMVIVDTYLAEVTGVVTEKTDAKGHVERDAYNTLKVYYTNAEGVNTYKIPGNDYAKGDMLLVNVSETKTVEAAGALNGAKVVNVVGEPETFDAKQTKVTLSTKKRELDDNWYDDAAKFFLGKATVDADKNSKTYTWYLDQFGNVIGAEEVETVYNYGVVTALKAVHATGLEDDYVVANITYVNGESVEAVKVASITSEDGTKYDVKHGISYDKADNVNLYKVNKDVLANHLFQISTDKDDNLVLTEESTDSKILTTTGAITTKGTTVGAAKIDDETVFVIRTGKGTAEKPYKFETVTGKNNIGNFESGKVHYVNGSDTYADYVYVINSAEEDVKYQFVYITGNDGYRKDSDGKNKYYLVEDVVGMDGTKESIGYDGGKIRVEEGLWLKDKNAADTATNRTDLAKALTTKGNLVMITLTDDYVTAATVVAKDGCSVALTKGDKLAAECIANETYGPGTIYDDVKLHENGNLEVNAYNDNAVTSNDGKNYNVTGATVLLDGEETTMAALEADALQYAKVKAAYVIRSTKSGETTVVTTIVLSTVENKNACDQHDDTYTVTVDGVLVAEVEAGETVVAKDYKPNGDGTGVKVGETYYAYDAEIVIEDDTTIETGFVAWTLDGGEPVAVPYGTTGIAVNSVFTSLDTYVKASWNAGVGYGPKDVDCTPSVDHAFESGYYAVTEDGTDDLITVSVLNNATDGKKVATGSITIVNDAAAQTVVTVKEGETVKAQKTLAGGESMTYNLTADVTVSAAAHA